MVVQVNDVGMVASEFRCGNLIYATVRPYEESKQIIKVEPAILMILNGEIKRENIRFEPIPLTEEILLKSGFEKSVCTAWDFFLRLSAINLRARKSSGHIYFELEHIYLGDSNLKYLHQLQNFCYSFGKELNIKLIWKK